MLDKNALAEIITVYKQDFQRIDREERYKWIAVKHFQDNWLIDALDFADMLERAFAKQNNLLGLSGVYKPLFVIVAFAQSEPENVRRLFKTLYDETQPLEDRINEFVGGVELFVSKMKQEDPELWKNTFQDLHAVSVYLTFKEL